MANNVKPKGDGWSTVINGIEIRQVHGGLMLGTGMDAVFIKGDQLRLTDPTPKMQGSYPDYYPFKVPHDHAFDEENMDEVLDETFPPDGTPLDIIPRAIRELKRMVLGNVSVKANFPQNPITGEYEGTLEKGDLVSWDPDSSSWVAAECPKARGITDKALFTGVAFPDSDQVISAANVVCDTWNLTPGQAYYLDCENPGKMTDVDTGYYVGVAQSATAMYFAPYASSIEQVITKMQNQISTVDTAMQELQTAFEGVQTTVEEIQAVVEEVKANDDQVNQKLQDLSDRADTAHTQLVDALARVGQLEATDALHTTYFNNIANQFQTVTTTISNMANNLAQSDEEIRQNVAQVQAQVDAIKETLAQGTEKWAELVEKHETDIAELREALGDCTCEKLTTAIQENVESIVNLDGTIQKVERDLEDYSNNHNKNYQELKEGHNVLYGQVQDTIQKVTENKAAINQATGRITKNEADIQALKLKDIDLDAAIQGNKGLIDANAIQITENKAAVEILRSDVTTWNGEFTGHLENINQRLVNHDAAITDVESVNTKQTSDILAVSTRVLTLENILSESIPGKCECDFTEVNQAIAQNAADINKVNTELSVTQNHVIEMRQDVDNLKNSMEGTPDWQEKIDAVTTRVDAVEQKNTNQDTVIKNLKDLTFDTRDKVTKLTPEVEKLQVSVDAIEQKIENGEIGGGSGEYDPSPLIIRIAANEDAIKALQGVDSTIEDFLGFQDGTPPVVEEGKSFVEVVNTLETQVNTFTEKVTEIEPKLTTIEGKVTEVQTGIAEIQTNVGEIEGDVTSLQASVTDLTSKVNTNTSAIATNKSSIEALDTRLTNVEAGGGTGSGDVDLTPITSRLTAVESKNTEQDTTIASLQAVINGTPSEGEGDEATPAVPGISSQISTLKSSIDSLQINDTKQDGQIKALETSQAHTSEDMGSIQSTVTTLSSTQEACCAKVDVLEGRVDDLETEQAALKTKVSSLENELAETSATVDAIQDVIGESGGDTVSRVVTAPTFDMPNLVEGEGPVTLTFSSSSLLTSGNVASFQLRIPALSINTTLTATNNSSTYSLDYSALAGGTAVAVSVLAVDNLGNRSEVVTKSATIQAKAIGKPTIEAVSGGADIWSNGLTVSGEPFTMQSGSDTFAKATVKIKNGSTVLVTKDFTNASNPWNYNIPVSELTNLYNGGTFTVVLTYTSTGGLVSPEATMSFTVTGASITTPSLSSPAANAEILTTGSLIVTTSAFAKSPSNCPILHTSTDYKITSDAAGNNVVLSAIGSADLTSHTFTDLSALADDTTYYVWARHHGSIE